MAYRLEHRAVFALLFAASACGDSVVTGVVYADADGDGQVSPGDQPIAGAYVVWETERFAETDASGRFELVAPGPGQVWVRVPDGFEPSPVWATVEDGAGEAQVGFVLTPSRATGKTRFVHAADTHVGIVNAADVGSALAQATAGDPPLHFLTITGDITQGNEPAEFEALADALEGIDVPFVPVPGNHDWNDGGANYRRYLGPPMYSFDAGGAHFVVLNEGSEGKAPMVDFLAADTALLSGERLVIALMHFPPALAGAPGYPGDAGLVDALADAGVDYLFTGHWHTNRVMPHDEGFVEFNTQPMVNSGVDLTPGGYREVTRVGDQLVITHHTTVREPVVALAQPRPGACVDAGSVDIVASVELGHGLAGWRRARRRGLRARAPRWLGLRGGGRHPGGRLAPRRRSCAHRERRATRDQRGVLHADADANDRGRGGLATAPARPRTRRGRRRAAVAAAGCGLVRPRWRPRARRLAGARERATVRVGHRPGRRHCRRPRRLRRADG
jgi:hypothetical protein